MKEYIEPTLLNLWFEHQLLSLTHVKHFWSLCHHNLASKSRKYQLRKIWRWNWLPQETTIEYSSPDVAEGIIQIVSGGIPCSPHQFHSPSSAMFIYFSEHSGQKRETEVKLKAFFSCEFTIIFFGIHLWNFRFPNQQALENSLNYIVTQNNFSFSSITIYHCPQTSSSLKRIIYQVDGHNMSWNIVNDNENWWAKWKGND